MSKLFSARFALVAAVFIGMAGPASAGMFDETGIYGNLGVASFDGSQLTNTAVIGRVGARFSDYFGIEAQGGVGIEHSRFAYRPHCFGFICPLFVTLANAKLSNTEGAYAVGFLPLAPNADLFARVGYDRASYDAEPAFGARFDRTGVSFGAGAQYFFDGHNGFRFDFTRSQSNTGSYIERQAIGNGTNVWSIAFTHKF